MEHLILLIVLFIGAKAKDGIKLHLYIHQIHQIHLTLAQQQNI